MSEGDISQISVGEFETVSQLLASSESLQLAFIIMIIGIIAISAAYRKFSSLIKSKKIFYTKPHLSCSITIFCNCINFVNKCIYSNFRII